MAWSGWRHVIRTDQTMASNKIFLKAHQMVEWGKAQTEMARRCREWFTIAENEEVDAKGK